MFQRSVCPLCDEHVGETLDAFDISLCDVLSLVVNKISVLPFYSLCVPFSLSCYSLYVDKNRG